ncbi:MAG TPA: enoyl-CoA hydratase/isomerase family protein [Acidimicrobiales bacterium]|nr:enoyl-CoA hydratase/isomerase family protein [Acidimicrobiales bacterium]
MTVSLDQTTFVATVEIHRPPNNFFDVELIRSLAEAYEALDGDVAACRAVVLCSEGKHFCAGADFTGRATGPGSTGDLYAEALRLFRARTPVVAAVQGAAVGGGLGLACSADFRVVSPASRLTANFSRLGFHQGFGLSATLPRIVGPQRATELLYTGRRIDGSTAASIGLADRLVDDGNVRAAATELAEEIASAAPLAVRSIRETMRDGLADAVAVATAREDQEQGWLRRTADWTEGVRASAERREPRFEGR